MLPLVEKAFSTRSNAAGGGAAARRGGGPPGRDVEELIRQVQQAVYAAHGVHLEPEVRIVR